MLHGIDVSIDQGPIDWARVKGAGISFAYAKATEGITYTDDAFAANHDGAKAAGIAFGAYHFLRFGDAVQPQAEHFAAVIDGRQGSLAPMVDVEVADGCDNLVGRLSGFLTALQPLVKCQPIIYSSYGFWGGAMAGSDAFAGHRLWIAEYNGDSAPTLPTGWTRWAIWQHSQSGRVPGIGGDVDLDLLNGDDLSLIGGV